MARRRDPGRPGALGVDALPPFRDNPALPYRERAAAWQAWMTAFTAWKQRRDAWADAHDGKRSRPAGEPGLTWQRPPWWHQSDAKDAQS